MTTYIVGISDGMTWNAGGQTRIDAETVDDARRQAEEWADEGDYPVDPSTPPAVQISLWLASGHASGHARGENIDRWTHTVPASACSGSDAE